jgi:predicted nucleic acid-binding protein
VTIIFDSGALIAAERNNSRFATLLSAATKNRTPILIPTAVIAETWRGPKSSPRLARAINVASAEPGLSSELARRVGALIAAAGVAGIVDATVVALAAEHLPATIVTSDPNDIRKFASVTGHTYSLEEERRTTDITIFTL